MKFNTASAILALLPAFTSGAPTADSLTVTYSPKTEWRESAEKAAARAAAPVVAPTLSKVVKRQGVTHLYVCDSANFSGRCQNLETPRGGCTNLYSPFQDTISSVGPEQGTTCTVYENSGCSGRALGGIVYPGIYNLVDYNFNDIISSYRCS